MHQFGAYYAVHDLPVSPYISLYLPVSPSQFGSYYAVHVVREARLYGARPYALHATHVKVRVRVRDRVRVRG